MPKNTSRKQRDPWVRKRADAQIERMSKQTIKFVFEQMQRRMTVGSKEYGATKYFEMDLDKEITDELIDYLNWSLLEVVKMLIMRRVTLAKVRVGVVQAGRGELRDLGSFRRFK